MAQASHRHACPTKPALLAADSRPRQLSFQTAREAQGPAENCVPAGRRGGIPRLDVQLLPGPRLFETRQHCLLAARKIIGPQIGPRRRRNLMSEYKTLF